MLGTEGRQVNDEDQRRQGERVGCAGDSRVLSPLPLFAVIVKSQATVTLQCRIVIHPRLWIISVGKHLPGIPVAFEWTRRGTTAEREAYLARKVRYWHPESLRTYLALPLRPPHPQ